MYNGSISIEVYFLLTKQFWASEQVGKTVIQEAKADGGTVIFNTWLPRLPWESPSSNQPEGEKSKDHVGGLYGPNLEVGHKNMDKNLECDHNELQGRQGNVF